MAEVIGTLCVCVCQIRLSHLLVIGVASVLLERCASSKEQQQHTLLLLRFTPLPSIQEKRVSAGKSFSADCLFLRAHFASLNFFFPSPPAAVVVVGLKRLYGHHPPSLRVFVYNALSWLYVACGMMPKREGGG
jgi:hypothetical protein